MSEQRCGTCKWFPLDKVKDKAGRIRKNRVAQCQWKPQPVAYAFNAPIFRWYTTPEQGVECPTWEPTP